MVEEIEPRPTTVKEKATFEEMWDVISAESNSIWIAEQVRRKRGVTLPGELRRSEVMTACCVLLEIIMKDPDGFRSWARETSKRRK